MTTPMFATYRQGENRVTATFLAVLQRLSLPNIDRLLRAILDDGNFNLVSLQNQPKGDGSIPDARIWTGQAVWIETKTSRNSADMSQLKRHLKVVKCDEKLVLLTPDETEPSLLDKSPFLGDKRLVWSNFINLAGAIDDILNDADQPPTEREAFLLREFIGMLEADGLLFSPASRVLVIAAREAWPVYKKVHAYITHPRGHRSSGHLAFYADRKIQTVVPKIESIIDSVTLSQDGIAHLHGEAGDRAKELLTRLRKIGMYENLTAKVLFLSAPDGKETKTLGRPIDNNIIGKNGRRIPFTYGSPHYVTIESLMNASKTCELKPC